MSSTVLSAVILLAYALTFTAAQTSCKGLCGAGFIRGYTCQCDYSCMVYGECCKDFESQCTTKSSCKGRCGEGFKRGRLCSCDSDCVKYKQCCPDHNTHCDAEEEISGEASATAPVENNSCNNVNDNKPKEPTPNEATEPSPFSEGNNADDPMIPLVSPTSYPQADLSDDDPMIPLVNPTSYPQADLSDDKYSQIFTNEDFSNNDPEASPIPESTSGYGLSTADLLDQISTEPTISKFSTETFTVFSQTQTTISDIKPTQADDSPSDLSPTTEETPKESTDASDPTSSSDQGTTLPQPTTTADHVSSQPAPTSVPQTEYSPTANTPELEMVADTTVAPSDEPEVTSLPNAASHTPVAPVTTQPSQGSSTVLENAQATTIPASTLEPITIPEATTSNPKPDDTDSVTTGPPSSLADLEDPSTSVSPTGLQELDALTTHIPSSTDAVPNDTTVAEVTTADPLLVTPVLTKLTPSEATSKPQNKPDPYKPSPAKPTLAKPSSIDETKPLDPAQTLDDPRDYQADDSNDTNLCSGRPVSGATTLRNGTVVIFRGHYFWTLDRYMAPGPARGITQEWGVPSPIDTVFTRCNCQGKTYIFKGSKYWRFENSALDPNYPKVIETGFDGLRGQVIAALSVPQYRTRRESVYFFKRGGLVQKYSYQSGTSPTCGRKPQFTVHTVHNRMVRQAVSRLGPAVSFRTSWRGFPSTVTAAVSIPSTREPEGYKYYVFSRSKSYNVRMDSERPVIPPTTNASPESNDVFKCQKKVR